MKDKKSTISVHSSSPPCADSPVSGGNFSGKVTTLQTQRSHERSLDNLLEPATPKRTEEKQRIACSGKELTMTLHRAVRKGTRDEVKKILAQHPKEVHERDTDGQTALHVACGIDQISIAKLLIRKDADVNSQDSNGWTPLHCAASAGHLKTCELLLTSKNVRADILNKDGTSALVYVVKFKNAGQKFDAALYNHVLQLLHQKSADLNSRNKFGEVPLHYACLNGNDEAVRFLLKNKADVNFLNNVGESTLHYAVRSGRPDIVRALLDAGADLNIASEQAQTPIQVAISKGHKDIVQMLIEHPNAKEQKTSDANSSNMYKDAIKTGYLMKHIKKSKWQRMFFILKDHTLFYFNSPLDRQPQGSMDMVTTQVRDAPRDKTDKEFCFEITTIEKSYMLSAKNENSKQEWMRVLKSVGERVSKNDFSFSEESKHSIWKTTNANVYEQEELRREIITLIDYPENRYCADCNAYEPDWVSTSIGAYVCIECSGIHNSFNLLVKPVFLDQWTNEQIQYMKALGNVKANTLYEFSPQADCMRPFPEDPIDVKAAFIREKYVNKTYFARDGLIVPADYRMHKALLIKILTNNRDAWNRQFEALANRLCIPNHIVSLMATANLCVKVQQLFDGQPDVTKDSYLALLTLETERVVGSNRTFIEEIIRGTLVMAAQWNDEKTEWQLKDRVEIFEKIVSVFQQLQQTCHDSQATEIVRWWIPQLLQMLTVFEISMQTTFRNYLGKLFKYYKLNTSYAIYLLSGHYLLLSDSTILPKLQVQPTTSEKKLPPSPKNLPSPRPLPPIPAPVASSQTSQAMAQRSREVLAQARKQFNDVKQLALDHTHAVRKMTTQVSSLTPQQDVHSFSSSNSISSGNSPILTHADSASNVIAAINGNSLQSLSLPILNRTSSSSTMSSSSTSSSLADFAKDAIERKMEVVDMIFEILASESKMAIAIHTLLSALAPNTLSTLLLIEKRGKIFMPVSKEDVAANIDDNPLRTLVERTHVMCEFARGLIAAWPNMEIDGDIDLDTADFSNDHDDEKEKLKLEGAQLRLAKFFAMRQVYVLASMLHVIYLQPVAFSMPELWESFLSIRPVMVQLLEHLLFCACEGIGRSFVRKGISLLIVQMRWTVCLLTELQLNDPLPTSTPI